MIEYSYQELSLVTVKLAVVVLPSTMLVLTWVQGPPLDDDEYSETVYEVTGRPLAAVPCTAGQETWMARVVVGSGTGAPVAVGAAIVSGLPYGTALTPIDHGPLPSALTASTLNV